MATKGQIAWEMSESRCRKDGGKLVRITFQWPNNPPCTQDYSPHAGHAIARELKFNGAKVISIETIN